MASESKTQYFCNPCWYGQSILGSYMVNFNADVYYDELCEVCQSCWAEGAITPMSVPTETPTSYLCHSHAVPLLKNMMENKLTFRKYEGDDIICQHESECKELAVFYVHL